MKRYLEQCEIYKKLSPHTLKSYKKVVMDLEKIVGSVKPEKIRVEHIQKYISDMRGRGVSDETIKLRLVIIKTILNFLKNIGVEVLHSHLIDLPKVAQKGRQICGDVELEKFIGEVTNKRDKAILEIIKSSGMRISEVVSLKVSDIQKKQIPIVGKGGKLRLVFISDKARELVEDYLKDKKFKNSEFVFNGLVSNRHVTSACVQSIFRKIGKKVGVDINPNMLRHIFATRNLRSGVSLNGVQKLLGHSSINTTAIYLHITDEDLEKEWEKGNK